MSWRTTAKGRQRPAPKKRSMPPVCGDMLQNCINLDTNIRIRADYPPPRKIRAKADGQPTAIQDFSG